MFDLDYRLPTAVLAPTEGKAEAPGSSEKTASNVVDLALCGPIERGSADALCSTLRENAGANEIRLWVDSSGGNFAASFDLFVALHHHPAKKKVATIRRAESGALLAAMGCDRRIAEPHASLLIHPTRMMPEEAITAEKARELAETLEWADGQCARIFAYRTGRPIEVFFREGRTETAASIAWCLEAGIIHEVSNG